jgi:hypothetical protein
MIDHMLITNNAEFAAFAVGAGMRRIFVDLEILGKRERQGRLDTHISNHTIGDVARIRAAVPNASLLVRLNPWNDGSADELEAVLNGGADLVMLPMFRSPDEVEALSASVASRAEIVALVETPEALRSVDDLVQVPGLNEVYVGLNDLHLGLGLSFMFEPLSNGMLDRVASTVLGAGLRVGFGGVARVGEGLIPGEIVLGEHVRLGSTSVILSRTFHRADGTPSAAHGRRRFAGELAKLRAAEASLRLRSPAETERDRASFVERVAQVVASRSTT